MPLWVVRHANAGRRSAYEGDDRLRPLSTRGYDRAVALVPLLARHQPRAVLSSPYLRCIQTMQPLAEALAVPVEPVEGLAEGHGAEAVRLLRDMAGDSAVLCTHGDVATTILETLAPEADAAQRAELRLQKGDVWVIESSGGLLSIVEHIRRVNRDSRSR